MDFRPILYKVERERELERTNEHTANIQGGGGGLTGQRNWHYTRHGHNKKFSQQKMGLVVNELLSLLVFNEDGQK